LFPSLDQMFWWLPELMCLELEISQG